MNISLKRLVSLWKLLATETQLSRFVTPKDCEVLERRTEAEGEHFLTVTLPGLFKALDRSFQTGWLDTPKGFKCGRGSAYPLMLSRAWEVLFTKDGLLRFEVRQLTVDQTSCQTELVKDESPETSLVDVDTLAGAVACIRQLSAIFYKLELPYTEEQEASVIQQFVRTDRQLSTLSCEAFPEEILREAKRLIHRLLRGVDPLAIRPKHGSGASACGVQPHRRYSTFRYIPRLHEVFPYEEHFYYSLTHLCDSLDEWLDMRASEPVARVVFVPKDSRGPRLISCEPREFMFIQQGLWAKLNKTVEHHPNIAAQVSFTDQMRNRRLASLGSKGHGFATLDLKEASDRVSWELVVALFPERWSRALGACRSRGTKLPNGKILPFYKFAPMGSACCFPVEALIFWSISLAAMGMSERYLTDLFDRPTPHRDWSATVSVFGDDIIVPTRHAERVMKALESFGLLVNRDKSYWKGPFRESCGADCFAGVDVTPVRVKALPSDDRVGYARTINMANNLIARYGEAYFGDRVRDLLESWYGPIPVSSNFRTTEGIGRDEFRDRTYVERLHSGVTLYGRYTSIPRRFRTRVNPYLQRQEFRVLKCGPINNRVDSDSWGYVLRKELEQLLPWTVSTHALAKRVRIKYGWTTC